MEAIATRVEAIASRLEAIAARLEAIATRVEAIATRVCRHRRYLRSSSYCDEDAQPPCDVELPLAASGPADNFAQGQPTQDY